MNPSVLRYLLTNFGCLKTRCGESKFLKLHAFKSNSNRNLTGMDVVLVFRNKKINTYLFH